MRHDWVVYAKTPLAGPEVVLDYLSRYTHRVAVSNERIVGIDAKGVRLRVRADDQGGKRTVLIDGPTFIARFLQHVLPPGFKRIRHYGLLSPAVKPERLAHARAALAMPASNPRRCEDAAAFLQRVTGIEVSCCPHCRLGHWRTVQLLPPLARRLGTANGSMQGTTVSPVGYITVHRPVRCRRPNGGADRAQPRDHAARASFGDPRWPIRHAHAPASPARSQPIGPADPSHRPHQRRLKLTLPNCPARHRTSSGSVHRRLSAAAKSARSASAVRRQISALRSPVAANAVTPADGTRRCVADNGARAGMNARPARSVRDPPYGISAARFNRWKLTLGQRHGLSALRRNALHERRVVRGCAQLRVLGLGAGVGRRGGVRDLATMSSANPDSR